MADPVVLDAGPLLVYLQAEPGAEEVRQMLEKGQVWMNLVNLGEVVYIIERRQGVVDADDVFAEMTSPDPVDGRPPVRWLPVDERLVRQATTIKAKGGISYADSFAAASAALLGCPLVACADDEEFKVAERLGIQVRWIPKSTGVV